MAMDRGPDMGMQAAITHAPNCSLRPIRPAVAGPVSRAAATVQATPCALNQASISCQPASAASLR
jgi:hypothetical protein